MEYFTDKYRTSNERDFYINHRLLGATTSPQTANQIQEASSRLNAGVKHVELELISPDLFDSVPKQHFEEMRRIMLNNNIMFSNLMFAFILNILYLIISIWFFSVMFEKAREQGRLVKLN